EQRCLQTEPACIRHFHTQVVDYAREQLSTFRKQLYVRRSYDLYRLKCFSDPPFVKVLKAIVYYRVLVRFRPGQTYPAGNVGLGLKVSNFLTLIHNVKVDRGKCYGVAAKIAEGY